MKKFLLKRWYIILIILGLIGFFAFRSITASQSAQKQNPYTVKQVDLREEISLSGNINAHEKAIVRFQTGGLVAWVGVQEGDYVEKFQSIASLDQREIQKTVKKYLNTYDKTRAGFDQVVDDNEEEEKLGMTQELRDASMRLIDQSQADLNISVLDLEIAELSRQFANIYAPINGTVIRVDSPFAGVNVIPTQAEFEIANLDSIYFSATADQEDVVKLYNSQSGDIVLDAFPDDTTAGVINSISYTPKTDETGTSYEVKIALTRSSTNYRLGMTGDVTFVLKETPNIIAIPDNYVITEENRKYVWKDVSGKVVKTEVEIGAETEDLIEITSGLKKGDIIYDQT